VVVTDKDIIAVGVRGKSSCCSTRADGRPRWDYDSRNDMHWGFWPMVVAPLAAMNDDPCASLMCTAARWSTASGPTRGPDGRDAERFYWTIPGTSTDRRSPGPATCWSIADIPEGKVQWSRAARRRDAMDIKDELGGVTLDGDSVFLVASYQYTTMAGSRLRARHGRSAGVGRPNPSDL